MKPRYRDRIIGELSALAIPNMVIGRFNHSYIY